MTSADIKLLVDGIDDGLDTAASSINASIHPSVRALATTQQKLMVIAYVALKRAGVI